MIAGFNTDVQHEGHVYHVQTEDRGTDNPIFESLVYVGGTIVAKKRTAYSDQLNEGASREKIASLLKRQHQVIIAAIKAGRVEDLIRYSRKEQSRSQPQEKQNAEPPLPSPDFSQDLPKPVATNGSQVPAAPVSIEPSRRSVSQGTDGLDSPAPSSSARRNTGGLNLDQVISDYLSHDQAQLDVSVLTPAVFTAGKSVGLRVQVTHDAKPEFDAIVTVKIIGTAFKPQVFMGRVGSDGVASFSLTLPAFAAGTAAIVIEARSAAGRGELKNLIRRV